LIHYRQPEVEVTIFYIDIQTVGSDFHRTYPEVRKAFRFIRTIPADIVPIDDGRLSLTYFDPSERASRDANFDLVVLSTGMVPPGDRDETARRLQVDPSEHGFAASSDRLAAGGVFLAGSVQGPMTIREASADAVSAAFAALRYLYPSCGSVPHGMLHSGKEG
jgi:heterodisulfide reductase subunit A